jgi:PKD repeat protein
VALDLDLVAQTLTAYVDGNQDQQATGVTTASGTLPTSNFNLGATGTATSITGAVFNGTIEEFRWWGEARSQAQIQAGMLGEIPEVATRAIFSSNLRSGPAHLLVAFRDHSVTVAGATITSWLWDFGDGNQSIAQNPCHAYTTPGQYTVSLTVTDSNMGSNTLTFPNYINVTAAALGIQTCGQGDLYMASPPPPLGWSEAFLFMSQQTALITGSGWFFGIYPDALTWSIVGFPSGPGNLIHPTNAGNPGLWPDAPVVLPPGTVTTIQGLTFDFVLVFLDPSMIPLTWTNVSRTLF